LPPLREDVRDGSIERRESAVVEKATERNGDHHFGHGHNADGRIGALEAMQEREAIEVGLAGTVGEVREEVCGPWKR